MLRWGFDNYWMTVCGVQSNLCPWCGFEQDQTMPDSHEFGEIKLNVNTINKTQDTPYLTHSGFHGGVSTW